MSDEDRHYGHKKKRVGKACDLCRIKKTKCDGKKPCNRCLADNKVCVFTESRRHREKARPEGYVELLETRLNLLTKALERICLLLQEGVPFVKDLVTKHTPPGDEPVVPINEVVAHLIAEKGMLRDLPLEWERGALIAASLSLGSRHEVELASHSFAERRRSDEDTDDDDRTEPVPEPASEPVPEVLLPTPVVQQIPDPDSAWVMPDHSLFRALLFLDRLLRASSVSSLAAKLENLEHGEDDVLVRRLALLSRLYLPAHKGNVHKLRRASHNHHSHHAHHSHALHSHPHVQPANLAASVRTLSPPKFVSSIVPLHPSLAEMFSLPSSPSSPGSPRSMAPPGTLPYSTVVSDIATPAPLQSHQPQSLCAPTDADFSTLPSAAFAYNDYRYMESDSLESYLVANPF